MNGKQELSKVAPAGWTCHLSSPPEWSHLILETNNVSNTDESAHRLKTKSFEKNFETLMELEGRDGERRGGHAEGEDMVGVLIVSLLFRWIVKSLLPQFTYANAHSHTQIHTIAGLS